MDINWDSVLDFTKKTLKVTQKVTVDALEIARTSTASGAVKLAKVLDPSALAQTGAAGGSTATLRPLTPLSRRGSNNNNNNSNSDANTSKTQNTSSGNLLTLLRLGAAVGATAALGYALYRQHVPKISDDEYLDLYNKCVVVTGGGTGIGRAVAVRLRDRGAHVVLCGRREGPLRETAALLGARHTHASVSCDSSYPHDSDSEGKAASGGGGCTVVHSCDVADEVCLARLVAAVKGVGLPLAMVVLNAGRDCCGEFDTSEQTMSNMREIFELNYFTNVRLAQLFLPLLQEAAPVGGGCGGAFCVVSSLAGLLPVVRANAYSPSKHALRVFFDILRLEQEVERQRFLYDKNNNNNNSTASTSARSSEEGKASGDAGLSREHDEKRDEEEKKKKKGYVTVTTVCPGFTVSDIHQPGVMLAVRGAPPPRRRDSSWLSCEEVAEAAVDAAVRRVPLVAMPRLSYAAYVLRPVAPRLADWLTSRAVYASYADGGSHTLQEIAEMAEKGKNEKEKGKGTEGRDGVMVGAEEAEVGSEFGEYSEPEGDGRLSTIAAAVAVAACDNADERNNMEEKAAKKEGEVTHDGTGKERRMFSNTSSSVKLSSNASSTHGFEVVNAEE